MTSTSSNDMRCLEIDEEQMRKKTNNNLKICSRRRLICTSLKKQNTTRKLEKRDFGRSFYQMKIKFVHGFSPDISYKN